MPISFTQLRSPTAIVALSITAAGLALYLVYTSFEAPTGTSLHRSNAIRRRHRGTGRQPAADADENNARNTTEGQDEQEQVHQEVDVREDGVHGNQGDTETLAETDVFGDDTRLEPPIGEEHKLMKLLFHIAEEKDRINSTVHRGVVCNSCDVSPIRGIRWRCANCLDYDLCSDCEATSNHHDRTHVFYKIKVPAPFLGPSQTGMRVLYPGNPSLLPLSLPPSLKRRLTDATRFEFAEVDAMYSHFACLANMQWPDDPSELGAAIDRRAFDKVFIPMHAIGSARPNLIFDRAFHFFDSNGDGLIGFEEFLQGQSLILSQKWEEKLRPVFAGYDIDGDGFISREDVMRVLKAYYALQKEITTDLLSHEEEDLAISQAMETIQSSQPLGSRFSRLTPPRGDRNVPQGKQADQYGDLMPTDGGSALVLDSGNAPVVINGYEIPQPEVDEGQDILYQVTMQGMHELIDPLFKQKEDQLAEVRASKPTRQKWRKEINAFKEQSDLVVSVHTAAESDPLLATAAAVEHRTQAPHDVSDLFSNNDLASNEHNDEHQEGAVLDPTIRNRPLVDLLRESGYTLVEDVHPASGPSGPAPSGPAPSAPTTDSSSPPVDVSPAPPLHLDPTMPQNRPNTTPPDDRSSASSSSSSAPAPDSAPSAPASEPSPSNEELLRLAMLDTMESALESRRGSQISFAEFEQAMVEPRHGQMRAFLMVWLEVGGLV